MESSPQDRQEDINSSPIGGKQAQPGSSIKKHLDQPRQENNQQQPILDSLLSPFQDRTEIVPHSPSSTPPIDNQPIQPPAIDALLSPFQDRTEIVPHSPSSTPPIGSQPIQPPAIDALLSSLQDRTEVTPPCSAPAKIASVEIISDSHPQVISPQEIAEGNGTEKSTTDANEQVLPAGLLSSHRIFADRYQILKKLGQGGMGAVYKAIDMKFNRVVAIKMILSHLQLGTIETARFEQEAQVMARLQHPNMIPLYEFHTQPCNYLVMEFVAGKTFKEILDEQKLNFVQIANIIEKCARALHAAHQQGIIHRDIKPGNIMIEAATSIPKVMDFGLAKVLTFGQGITQSPGSLMGTPGYMSPEQVQRYSNLWRDTDQHPNTKNSIPAMSSATSQLSQNHISSTQLSSNPVVKLPSMAMPVLPANQADTPLPPLASVSFGVQSPEILSPPSLTKMPFDSSSQPGQAVSLPKLASVSLGMQSLHTPSLTPPTLHTPSLKIPGIQDSISSSQDKMEPSPQINTDELPPLGDISANMLSAPKLSAPAAFSQPQQSKPDSLPSLGNISANIQASALETPIGSFIPQQNTTDSLPPLGDTSANIQPISSDMKLPVLSDIDGRSDIYALGATLYYAVTGRAPFNSVMAQVRLQDPIRPRTLNFNIPHDLETIILKCMEKERKNRYDTAQELADDLLAFQSNLPIKARPIGIITRLYKWMMRNPIYGLLALLMIVTNVLVGIFSLHQSLYATLAKNELEQTQSQNISRRQELQKLKLQEKDSHRAMVVLKKEHQTLQEKQDQQRQQQEILEAKLNKIESIYQNAQLFAEEVQTQTNENQAKLQKQREYWIAQLQRIMDEPFLASQEWPDSMLDNFSNINATGATNPTPSYSSSSNPKTSFSNHTNRNSTIHYQQGNASYSADASSQKTQLVVQVSPSQRVGQVWKMTITYTNASTILLTNVQIVVHWGKDIQCYSNESGQLQENQVQWSLLSLAPHQSKSFTLHLIATQAGYTTLEISATNAQNISQMQTCTIEVKNWEASIAVLYPQQQNMQQNMTAKIIASNFMEVPLSNVMVTMDWDTSLSIQSIEGNPHISNNKATWQIPYLAVGKSQVFTIQFANPTKSNMTTLNISAANQQALLASPTLCSTHWVTNNTSPLQIKLEAPSTYILWPYLQNQFTWMYLEIKNTSQEKINGITIQLQGSLPTSRLESLVECSQYFKTLTTGTDTQLLHYLGDLDAGQSRKLLLIVQHFSPGMLVTTAQLHAANHIAAQTQTTTEIRGYPNLSGSFVSSATRISIQETALFEFEVNNLGSAEDQNIQVYMEFPSLLEVLEVVPNIPGTIQGNKVFFQTWSSLQPRNSLRYSVRTKGIRQGSGEVKVEVISRFLSNPILARQSIMVVHE